MDTPSTRRSFLRTAPYRHLSLIVTCLGILWIGYIVWQLSDLYADQPLPPERISAKQLRVSEGQRQSLLKSISDYTSATAPVPKTLPSFQADTGS